MTKIVYNACFGGFGLSEAAMMRYAELKGLTLYPDRQNSLVSTYWTVPPDQQPKPIDWKVASAQERKACNEAYESSVIYDRNIARNDPALVQVVEELGDAASDKYARLRVREITDGERYRIDEYDGSESVMTIDDYEWSVAG
jgi:hypothetical protein